jgi:hypothetical protein
LLVFAKLVVDEEIKEVRCESLLPKAQYWMRVMVILSYTDENRDSSLLD